MSEVGLGDTVGRALGSRLSCVAWGSPLLPGQGGPCVGGGEVVSRAWVDTGFAPGRSYKCVEQSDLKYPLIHGQGRQVSEWRLQESVLNCPL